MLRLQIFEWSAWSQFLITYVAPGAEQVMVKPGLHLCSVEQRSAPALLHVNLSRPRTVFPDYENWLASYERVGLPVLNGYCQSIDKWAVQDACAAAGVPQVRAGRRGDPDELLIIKTRANHFGQHELRLPRALVGDMCPPPWPYPERVHMLKRKDMPDIVWNDPRIAVERYIANAEGRFQRAYVVGEYVAVATASSPGLVKNMQDEYDLVSTRMGSDRPVDRRDSLSIAFRLAQAMRVDFAAIDLALDDTGAAYPIDVNTTPFWGKHTAYDTRLIVELTDALKPLMKSGSRYAPTSTLSPV